jgi:hypothetical protein
VGAELEKFVDVVDEVGVEKAADVDAVDVPGGLNTFVLNESVLPRAGSCTQAVLRAERTMVANELIRLIVGKKWTGHTVSDYLRGRYCIKTLCACIHTTIESIVTGGTVIVLEVLVRLLQSIYESRSNRLAGCIAGGVRA